ncbi:VOC family protein [Streptomyces sp. NBC_01214]|uniref:VOC family protein n=1 Tax=Streptomyces sp. NBC_01214 TaxID=2903777 RepID=UPI00225764C8|nr:VOC family protein [Streptomyces sp. NBC_01214]MCX4804486.1 VOC family protein [Streptomyces sp. NBC_01214]
MKITRHLPGAPCWADLDTPDVPSARTFYSSLFGWEALELPGGYVNFALRAEKIVGAIKLKEGEEHSAGWSVYFMTDDLVETTKAVEAAGGRVVSPPRKVSVAGSAAVYRAHDGALFGAWEPDKHPGSGLVREPGTPSWFGLSTPDVNGSAAFYEQVFGWTALPPTAGDTTRVTAAGDAEEFGGITEGPADSTGWSLHFGVEDVEAATVTAASLGGTVVSAPTDVTGVGRVAVLKDPSGVRFALVARA